MVSALYLLYTSRATVARRSARRADRSDRRTQTHATHKFLFGFDVANYHAPNLEDGWRATGVAGAGGYS